MTEAGKLGEAVAGSVERIGLPRDARFDLGVLFVHGIGQHARGDTLTEAAEALVEWLRRRIEPAGEVTVLDVVLRQPSSDGTAAAHAVIRIRPDRLSDRSAMWLLAEGWWAEVFRPATFMETATWGLLIGPWVFASQVYAIYQRTQVSERLHPLWRIALLPIVGLTAVGSLLLAMVGSLATTVLALGLTLLALLPVPVVSDLARRAQQVLAAGVGDAYVLTRSPVRFSAMVSQVRSDLRELRRRTRGVAIIAHSQGTAVAWATVKRELLEVEPGDESGTDAQRSSIRLLLTYGQAVRKLTLMLTIARGQVATSDGTIAAIAIAGFLVAAVATLIAGLWPLWTLACVALAALAQLYLLIVANRVDREARETIEEHWRQIAATEPAIRWLDLWASADTVPGGPLGVEGPRVTSYKIRNVGSPVDHVNYWQNTNEFLPILVAELGAIGGLPDLGGPGGARAPRITVAAMRRHSRVMILIAARFAVIGGAVAAALAAWQSPGFGSAVLGVVEAVPLLGPLVEDRDPWLSSAAGAAAVVVVAALGWLLAQVAWSGLVARDDRTHFAGGRRPLWAPRLWLVAVAAPVLAAALFTLALIVVGQEDLARLYLLAMVVLVPLALVVLSAGGVTLADAEPMEPSIESASEIAGARIGPAIVLTLAGALVLIPLLVALAAPAWLVPVLAAEAVVIGGILSLEGAREYLAFSRAFRERLNQIQAEPDER